MPACYAAATTDFDLGSGGKGRLARLFYIWIFVCVSALPGLRSVSCHYCNEILEIYLLGCTHFGFKRSTIIFQLFNCLCKYTNMRNTTRQFAGLGWEWKIGEI